MAYKTISQADARRYRKQRDEAREKLDGLLRRGTNQYCGIDLQVWGPFGAELLRMVTTAKRLGFAVFVTPSNEEGKLQFRAARPGGY